MALVRDSRRNLAVGAQWPRELPPVPARTGLAEYEAAAVALGLELMPWQRNAARFITALVKGRKQDRWKYPEVAIVVARQNGKTTLLLPRIRMGLARGESILHTAQNRILPRNTFRTIASAIAADMGQDCLIRRANGQEEIALPNGGRYKLIAPTGDAARGETADLVLIDEVREQRDQELMDAVLPTITARENAQVIYLSNAGDEGSVVLNNLRERGQQKDETIAYLEWSAGPDRGLDDEEGWAEANPALGHSLTIDVLRRFRQTRPATSFETEHMCRWVTTMHAALVDPMTWQAQRIELEEPRRPMMAVKVDPSGQRASAAIAWAQSDNSIGLRIVRDLHGDPINLRDLGEDLKRLSARMGVAKTGYDPETDTELSKYLRNPEAIVGTKFTSASSTFVNTVNGGRLRWDDADAVSGDLRWTGRKIDPKDGTFQAVKAKEDRPVTAVMAAIRAVALASGPQMSAPRIF